MWESLQTSISLGQNVYAIVGQPYPVIQVNDFARDPQGRIIVDPVSGLPSQNPNLTMYGNTNPTHILGVTSSLSYKAFNLSFVVVARDHLSYAGQPDDLWLAEFDALAWALGKSSNLKDCISKLQTFEWLPVEGRDFVVKFEPSTLAGETIECEVFYSF